MCAGFSIGSIAVARCAAFVTTVDNREGADRRSHRRNGLSGDFAGILNVRSHLRLIKRFSALQALDDLDDGIVGVVDFINQFRRRAAGAFGCFNAGFNGMRNLAEVHRADHPGAALHRVQQAGKRAGDFAVGGVGAPGAQLRRDSLIEIERLFKEDWQQLLVKLVL